MNIRITTKTLPLLKNSASIVVTVTRLSGGSVNHGQLMLLALVAGDNLKLPISKSVPAVNDKKDPLLKYRDYKLFALQSYAIRI